MEINELIESLRSMLPQKIPYGELVGAPIEYSRSGPMVFTDPEPYFIEEAIHALEAQQSRIAELEEALKDEMYRHDRLQDFEVAEAQVLAQVRAERDAALAKASEG